MLLSAAPHASHKYPVCDPAVLSYCRTIVLPGWGECAGNNIGVEGAKAIAEALTTNTTLTTLHLGGELFCMLLSAAPHASHKYHVCDPAVLSYYRTAWGWGGVNVQGTTSVTKVPRSLRKRSLPIQP